MIASSTRSRLQDYIDNVLSGEIVSCKAIQQAVQRHVDDLARQNTDEFPYYFDEQAAFFYCEAFPLLFRHSIGDFAGMPFELTDWQIFFVAVLFGWKRSCDGSRRFRRFLLEIARKGGKSTFIAALALLIASMDVNPHTKKPESVAEVLLAATKKSQSQDVVYAEIERMRAQSPAIAKRSKAINKRIAFNHNGGSIRTVSSDKPFDGLNPHCVLLDELHAWKEFHRKFYSTMQTGSGSRAQPIIGAITTAGDDQSHLWISEHDYAVAVLEKQHVDETLFVMIFQLDEDDDPFEETNWAKANPSMPVTPKVSYLREMSNRAKFDKLKFNEFMRYHCNRRTSSNSQAFDMSLWDGCRGELSDWRYADAIGYGVDLGGHDDLSAFAAVARFVVGEKDDEPVYRYEAKTWQFMSTETRRKMDEMPWAQWVHDGQVVLSQYASSQLLWSLQQEIYSTGCVAVGYDPNNARQQAEALTQEGIVVARVQQSYSLFNEPIRDLMQCIREGRFRHEGKTLLRWAVGNAVLVSGPQGLVMYDKKNSREKIDPVVALTMAFRIASTAPRVASGSLFIS